MLSGWLGMGTHILKAQSLEKPLCVSLSSAMLNVTSTLRCTETYTCVLPLTLSHRQVSPTASGKFLSQSLQESNSVSWGQL